jgi:hypothetical protein
MKLQSRALASPLKYVASAVTTASEEKKMGLRTGQEFLTYTKQEMCELFIMLHLLSV